ncbi:MAG: hypothetical protein EHM72_14705, partial [Calditrichaeota bacterium]
IHREWFEPKTSVYRYTFKASPEMSPSLYAHVSYLQPHLQTANDLPIRLYGVIPIAIVDRNTFLKPVIDCADEIRPDVPVTISIREATGKPMTYTLALVDQGLLDLTRFATPNPWNHFYSREALTVKTWDIYDWVAGAYGGKLDRLLAIGGDEHAEVEGGLQANRFPPLVQFLGPFELKASKTETHTLNLPPYIGAARLMVVAGAGRAYGSAEKSVLVRKPLILLATLPRVLSIREQVSLPLSLFVMDPALQTVKVQARVEGAAEISGDNTQTLIAPRTGEYQLQFQVKTLQVGTARVYLSAVSGNETAEQKIEITVRNPMGLQTLVKTSLLQTGEEWTPQLDLPGQAGSNVITLELSRIPPLDLKRRLEFLINYPHGCAEQTTSAVFPQLYLQKLIDLPRERQQEIEKNIKAGINKLRTFQTDDGGYSYWPGEIQSDPWCTNYVGCFLLEAKQAGYMIPAAQLESWKRYQQRTAQGWLAGDEQSTLIQADRLYSLALAGSAEPASMNRLKERKNLSITAKWRLAAAYQLAGQKDAALSLASGGTTLTPYRELSGTYGSDVRDTAILLETLTLLNDPKRAFPLVQALSASLSSDAWLSTQTTSFALAAIARYAGIFDNDKASFTYTVGFNANAKEDHSSSMPIIQQQWEVAADTTAQIFLHNSSKIPLFARLLLQGIPRIGQETASANGLELNVDYLNGQDEPIDISTLVQGQDFWAQVSVKHAGLGSAYEELALTQTFPPGWEIQNVRLTEDDREPLSFNYQDIRDDRVLTYFDLNRGELITFKIRLTAAYLGRYYLPPVQVEAMYDASIHARDHGKWIEVVSPN